MRRWMRSEQYETMLKMHLYLLLSVFFRMKMYCIQLDGTDYRPESSRLGCT